MRVVSHPKADRELEEAALYYERCATGLGHDFLDDFTKTISRIIEHPT